jgi:hypothetical protein
MDRRSHSLVAVLALSSSLASAGCGLLPSNRRVPPEPSYSPRSTAAPAPEVGFGSSPHPVTAPTAPGVAPPTNPYALDGSGAAAAAPSSGSLDVPTLANPAIDPGGANAGSAPR